MTLSRAVVTALPTWALLTSVLCVGACKPDDGPFLPTGPVLGVANMDDDDSNGAADWEDAGVSGEDDRTTLSLPYAVRMDLSGATDAVRVWQGDTVILDADTLSATLAEAGTVEVEFTGFLVTASLTLISTDDPDDTTIVALRSAPLILNHHLQRAERVVAMSASGESGNAAFIAGFSGSIGEIFTPVEIRPYQFDVWVQDEIELATLTAPGHRMDVVIDSVRSRSHMGLDDIAENEFQAPGVAVETWGSGRVTSQDSFGNLEVSPPVTVDGVHYPFGRIYWGGVNGRGLTDELAELLVAQKVQAPFEVDNTFLCVGHVDEFVSFVPDPASTKGFRMVYADTTLGRTFLEGLDPDTSLPRYAADEGYDTIGEILDDASLWASNEDMQRDYLDPNLEILVATLGLEEADIVRIPSVFKELQECGGGAVALIPGTANLVMVDQGDGATHLLTADPFLREDVADPASDPLIAEIERLLPATLTFEWVDDWDWYHLAWGDVHCGSNVQRTPAGEWWVDAAHLLEEGE